MQKCKKRGRYIFVTWYKHAKTGEIIYASDYGKKAFRIWIND